MANLPILCSGPPGSGLNLLSVLLDGHPELFAGPPLNLFGHEGLWRPDDPLDPAALFDRQAEIYPCPLWGPPPSRNLAYHFVTAAEIRHVMSITPDVAVLAHLVFAPRLVVEQAKKAVDVSPVNVFAAHALLERGGQVVFLLRHPIESIARQIKLRIRPVFAAAFWLVQAATALRLQAIHGADTVWIVRYEDLVARPRETLSTLTTALGLEDATDRMIARQTTLRRKTDPDLIRAGVRPTWRHDPFGPLMPATMGEDLDKVSHRFLQCLHALRTSPGLDRFARGNEETAWQIAEALDYALPDRLRRLPVLKPEEYAPQTAFEETLGSCFQLRIA